MAVRSEATRAQFEPRSQSCESRCLSLLAALCLLLPCFGAHCAVNRAVLVRELQLPKISLNLNITFSTSDLRIPISTDPEADITKVGKELETSDRPELHLRLARLLSEARRYEESGVHFRLAIGGFSKLLEKEPKNARAHQQYAEALIAMGEDEEAAVHIEKALILDASLWRAHELSADLHAKHAVLAHNQGMRELMRSHLAAAEEEAKEAVRLAPEDPRPLVMLFVTKWLPAVLELRLDPTSGLRQLGKFEEMSEILKKAAELAPTHGKLGHFAISCKLTPFFTAQMIKGLDAGIWGDLDEQQRRILTSCRDEFVALARATPELRSRALLFAGVTCFMMDDPKAMYEHLRAAADADPEGAYALEATIGFLAHEGKWAQAQEVAEEVRSRKPSGKAHTWIGRIYAEQGKWKQAEEAFRLAMSYSDSVGLANLGLGVALLKSNANPMEALIPLRTAWEQGRNEPEVLLAWGIVLALVGEVEEGKKYVQEVLLMWPPSPSLDRVAREFGIKSPAGRP